MNGSLNLNIFHFFFWCVSDSASLLFQPLHHPYIHVQAFITLYLWLAINLELDAKLQLLL